MQFTSFEVNVNDILFVFGHGSLKMFTLNRMNRLGVAWSKRQDNIDLLFKLFADIPNNNMSP